MSVSRRVAVVSATLALTLGAAGSASAITITTGTVNVTASAPLLGDVTNGLQTLLSGLVGATTTAACDVTGDSTVCTLKILSYAVATDYKKPNGQHVVKVTGGIVNLPTLVDATGDGLPDVSVYIQALSTSNIKMTIEKLLTAPPNFPVSVEALVNDPSSANRLINVGYDTRHSTAPQTWTAQASLTTGTTTSVNATLSVKNPPSTMAVVGGLYNQGPGGARLNPKQARLNYTPVPASSTVAFTLAPASTSGSISAATPTKADLELLMLDGSSGQHVTGTLDKLQKPVGVLLDKVDANGQQTNGTTGNTHVRLTTQKDVAKANLTYETIKDALVMQRVRLATSTLPGQTDFTQTPNGLLVDTDVPIATVAGGSAGGKAAENGNPAIPVPPNYPIESNETSYVHQDTTNQVDSTTFRVAGVQHVSVETTGAQENRKIAIGARLASAPLHALVTNDAAPGGSRYDATVENLPHNFAIAIALGQKRMLDFCGSTTDVADPCTLAGQASPAGIGKITLHDSYSPSPLFGRATHINGTVQGIPSTLGVDVETHAPADDADPDQNTKVHIDTTRPISQTTLRATDGSAPPADPADNGLIYIDTPAKYAMVAKVSGFERAHLDTEPKLKLDLIADSGHDFSYNVDLPDPKHIDGAMPNRPARTQVSLFTPEGAPTVLTVKGNNAFNLPVPTPKLLLNLTQPEPLFGKATKLQTDVTDIPSSVELTIDSRGPENDADPDQNTKVHVDADHAIGSVLLRATDGQAPPADPSDNGVIYQDQPGEPFAVIAKIDGFKSVHLDTKPKLDVSLTAASGHDLSYGIHLPPEAGKPPKDFTGVVDDRPATTRFFFDNPDAGPLSVHVEGKDANDNGAPTGGITLDALHLDDDPAEKIHNVRVNLDDLPPALDLVKQPSVGDEIDIDVTTTGGPIGLSDVQLDNDVLPDQSEIPALPADGGGAIVFTGGGRFFMHARVKKLLGVSLKTEPQLDAGLNVAEAQDFRIYLNTGVGDDGTINVNNCDDWDPAQHNGPHVEYHDVNIKAMQPNTQFDYVTGHDGNADLCERKEWRTIEYSADERADSIQYDTNVGDMAHLRTIIGQEGSNPLKVPHHLKVCQAGDDECFNQINRYHQCEVLGVDYDYCSTYSADTSVYLEAFGEKTHLSLNFCSLNVDLNDHANCTRPGATKGVFVKFNMSHVDLGYAYDTGFGFLTVNTQKHTADGQSPDGPNQGANGFIRAIDHTSTAEFINLNFGYDGSGNEWDAPSSTFDNHFGIITFGAPLVGSSQGSVDCQEPAYGPSWDETDSYFHVILDAAGSDEDDLGDNLTNLLCGLF